MRGLYDARRLLEGFLPGWLEGTFAQVGAPLGEDEVEAAVRLAREHGVASRLLRRRAQLARKVLPDAPVAPFAEEDVRLLAAVHNLLALGHPELDRLDARPAAHRRAAHFTWHLVERLRRPQHRLEAVAKHTLVGRLFDAERTDAEVRAWVGRTVVRGRPIPRRLTRWRRLRRVRVRGWQVRGLELCEREEQVEILDRLLLLSPITDLLQAGRTRPRFRLGGRSVWLADSEICRAVLYGWLAQKRPAAAAENVAQALFVRVRAEASREEVTLIAHTLYHLHLLLLLEDQHRGAPALQASDPLDRWWCGQAPLFPALILALRADPRTARALPGDEALGPDLAERLRAFDAVARSRVGEEAWERASCVVAALAGETPLGNVKGCVSGGKGARFLGLCSPG